LILIEIILERADAILLNFGGTLCPTSSIKYDSNSSNYIPRSTEDILHQISLTIPIGIITSKDFALLHLFKKEYVLSFLDSKIKSKLKVLHRQ
jgi:hypothetical protein